MHNNVYGAVVSLKVKTTLFPSKMNKTIHVEHYSQEKIQNITIFKAT